MHTLMDLRCNLPVFVYPSEASVHDVKILEKLYIEPDAIYVIDLGYLDFFRMFNLIHMKRAFFVSRAKDNMQYVKDLHNVLMTVHEDKNPSVADILVHQ